MQGLGFRMAGSGFKVLRFRASGLEEKVSRPGLSQYSGLRALKGLGMLLLDNNNSCKPWMTTNSKILLAAFQQ